MWTKDYLRRVIQEQLADYLLVVVSNRQPFSHVLKNGKVVCQRQPGGLVTGLMPVMQAVQGSWIAVGTSSYDRLAVDKNNRVMLPPEDPSYALRRVFLSKTDMDRYYYGYCNEGLWPLAHVAYTRPHFPAENWDAYEKVNQIFAKTILEEVGDRKAFVWVQDFHLTRVAKYLKDADRPNIITSLFWHIPWPNPEVFGICPQKKEILEGLLAYDLLGFQIRYHADNFLGSVDRELESRIDREKSAVIFHEHETLVRPFPISVDFQGITTAVGTTTAKTREQELQDAYSLGDKKLILGVDRIDYTKGIPDRFRAIDRFVEKYPEFKEKFVFLQIGEVSRAHVPRYRELNDEINRLADEVNWRHGESTWLPIVIDRSGIPYQDILLLHHLADVCIVSSLHDGMNLVSKEFVAARPDLGGTLILSQFAGASRELTDAILINPYDPESFADAIAQALTMPSEEKEKRMTKMRAVVEQNNIFRWAGKVLSQFLKFEFQEE